MTRTRLAAALVALAALAWWLAGTPGIGGSHAGAPPPTVTHGRSVDPAFQQQLGNLGRTNRTGAIDWQRSEARAEHDDVVITGKVVDEEDHAGVGNIEVVFKNALGESSTTSNADGTYRIEIAPGTYRAYVRDDNALSVGMQDLVRLPGMPTLDAAGTPDEGLMPTIIAATDVDHVDLSVVYGGAVAGHVVDRSGHPVVGAVIRARGSSLRPALGTDVAESDERGQFDMRLPPGQYVVEATHAKLAGVTGNVELDVERGQTAHPTVTLTAGCVIAGRVVGPDGRAANDGAIEKRFGEGPNEFTPSGRIEADGTFRWVTVETESVSLRAWPWKSPPAAAQTFACRDGARFEHVVFQIPNQAPDIAGTLVDAGGEAVAFGFIDVNPVDGGFGQQERTDAQGRWAVYHMPAARYRITAPSPSRGVVATEIVAPNTNVKLALGGTGRIEGTTTTLAEGSFELSLQVCDGLVGLPHAPRLVAVHGGKFAVDDVPACALTATATWQGEDQELEVTVPASGVVHADIDVGPAREKTVHGIVRDEAGHPVAGATVVAFSRARHSTEVETDAAGAYKLSTVAGADVMAGGGDARQGFAKVGRGSADDEQIDLVLRAPTNDDEGGDDVGPPGLLVE